MLRVGELRVCMCMYLLADKVCCRVVEESFEDGHESVFVLPEEAESEFAGFAEWAWTVIVSNHYHL